MMTVKRVPLVEEPISGTDTVAQYDDYAGLYMAPEYKYFVWKILHRGIRNGKVLDIGTGTGRLAIELAKAKNCNFEIMALDISENMLERARKNARKSGVDKKIKFVLATASGLPFPDRSFDLVISYASLHHWASPVVVFNEINRVTREQGTVIIRDNRRIYGNLFWEAFIGLTTLFQKQQNRQKWAKAILASYTISEIKDLLEKSDLKNYHLGTDFVKFDLSIEVPGKH
jgi:ubiquinone/menaquinone biosynthesis C-methylase UbiE